MHANGTNKSDSVIRFTYLNRLNLITKSKCTILKGKRKIKLIRADFNQIWKDSV